MFRWVFDECLFGVYGALPEPFWWFWSKWLYEWLMCVFCTYRCFIFGVVFGGRLVLRGRGWMGVRLVQYLTVVQVAPHEWVMGPLGGC